MDWLLEHGADPNVPLRRLEFGMRESQRGERPLHRLAAMGYGASVLKQFVAHGALVDAERADGCTPLRLAYCAGNQEAIDVLLGAGADASRVTVRDRLLEGCLRADTAQVQALITSDPTLVSQLVSAQDDEMTETLLTAISRGRDQAVRLMVSIGWPLDRESPWGGTPLHWAAWLGREEAVTQLIVHGAAVNVRDSRYGSSPLGWAIHGSRFNEEDNTVVYPRIVERLLDAGATRPESINQWDEAPEQWASDAILQLLQARGFSA